jgi:hypothetical protein
MTVCLIVAADGAPVGKIRSGLLLRREACHRAVFSGKLPSMEAEIDDKLPYKLVGSPNTIAPHEAIS